MSYSLNFAGLTPYLPQFASGLLATIQLTLISTSTGLFLGTICAMGRIHHNSWVRAICSCYIEVVRNTPFIVQLFFIFFGLPAIGFTLNAWEAAILSMTLNLSAYSAEIIRAGIDATPKGQWEAAKVLGLTKLQTLVHVVLSPAYQRVYPALVSQCIIVMLGSAVISQIALEELTFAANFVQSRSFLTFEAYTVTALIYLSLAIFMRFIFSTIKRVSFKNPSL